MDKCVAFHSFGRFHDQHIYLYFICQYIPILLNSRFIHPLHSGVTGTYAGYVTLSGTDLQLCQDAANILDSALKFGNKYKKSVSLLL